MYVDSLVCVFQSLDPIQKQREIGVIHTPKSVGDCRQSCELVQAPFHHRCYGNVINKGRRSRGYQLHRMHVFKW